MLTLSKLSQKVVMRDTRVGEPVRSFEAPTAPMRMTAVRERHLERVRGDAAGLECPATRELRAKLAE